MNNYRKCRQFERLQKAGIAIRRALSPEAVARVRERFSEHCVGEAEVALSCQPISCSIAIFCRHSFFSVDLGGQARPLFAR